MVQKLGKCVIKFGQSVIFAWLWVRMECNGKLSWWMGKIVNDGTPMPEPNYRTPWPGTNVRWEKIGAEPPRVRWMIANLRFQLVYMAITKVKSKNSAEGDTFWEKWINLEILIEHIVKLPVASAFWIKRWGRTHQGVQKWSKCVIKIGQCVLFACLWVNMGVMVKVSSAMEKDS